MLIIQLLKSNQIKSKKKKKETNQISPESVLDGAGRTVFESSARAVFGLFHIVISCLGEKKKQKNFLPINHANVQITRICRQNLCKSNVQIFRSENLSRSFSSTKSCQVIVCSCAGGLELCDGVELLLLMLFVAEATGWMNEDDALGSLSDRGSPIWTGDNDAAFAAASWAEESTLIETGMSGFPTAAAAAAAAAADAADAAGDGVDDVNLLADDGDSDAPFAVNALLSVSFDSLSFSGSLKSTTSRLIS